MILNGKLYAESPIYRGNARKTLFTRDGDGLQKLVSLAGEIEGTAQALMDAFVGESRDGKNIGLLNRLWLRLYDAPMPKGLVTRVECRLQEDCYPRDRFFDLRMGLRLDEDRWAAEANANYKMETLLRHSVFDLTLSVNDAILQQNDNAARLFYLLQELREGRFWFGAGKSKGLGRCRLEMDLPFSGGDAPPRIQPAANHLRIDLTFDAANPVLVGWNWGKVDPEMPSFAAIEGRLLVGAMKNIPDPIRARLELTLGGPILSPEDWKARFAAQLPRAIAIWLMERASEQVESWTLPQAAIAKLSKGKMAPSPKTLSALKPLAGQTFSGKDAAQAAIMEATGGKATLAERVMALMERKSQAGVQFNQAAWAEVAQGLGLDAGLQERLAPAIQDEAALTEILAQACLKLLPRLYEQVDQHVNLLRSDAWVDVEIANRQEHLNIKLMLLEGRITEQQWDDRYHPPEGVSAQAWLSFLDEHSRVRFHHITHPANLRKSIANDRNFIAFLTIFRDRTRQELAQPHHIDFRAGGPGNREISKKYGKAYDTVFMRMLEWSPAAREQGAWQVYVPGSTLKGAFRRRASQVLKTLWGESPRVTKVLDRLFGAQRLRGLAFFSDAYLMDPLDPDRSWCSMDGVRMDPKTGQPIEAAKRDYLFAYGGQLKFHLRIDLQDIDEDDIEAVSLLTHLIQDFHAGDIPIGGEKTSGFGWVQANVTRLEWLTGEPDGVGVQLFGKQPTFSEGIWQKWSVEGEPAAQAVRAMYPLPPLQANIGQAVPRSSQGFASHRAFGGCCGLLDVEAEILTPTNVRESGEPSFTVTLPEGPVNGWDFFAMAAPRADMRGAPKLYALPSRSLKGMLRHIYAIASDSGQESQTIGQLNPADSLFGWVGSGPNQALMGRLSFSFGLFDQPELAWFKVPYPYGKWRYVNGEWQTAADAAGAAKLVIAKNWRLFPHAPLAPLVRQVDEFKPDTVQASYFRAILPGARARFTIRFWNLEEEELQRLIWCVALEPGLAHKLGNNRYLGFGSARLRILPQSFLINWEKRYLNKPQDEWRRPLKPEEWIKPGVVKHYADLQRALDAKRL